MMDILQINALAAEAEKFSALADKEYKNNIFEVARDIYKNRDCRPVILISGPSGSGKTTTALMLEKFLDSWGCETHTLSMDNYFLPLCDDEKCLCYAGKLDLESPDRVDIPFLNSQLEEIIACRPVELPRYNFIESTREGTGKIFVRKPGELVILEGIHALNPEVITIPDSRTSRIYVSVRTEVTCEDVVLPPSKIRLLRRMTRDSLFRNRIFEDTVAMFKNVERGEELYIAPYSHRATYSIDTFVASELGVYKKLLMHQLENMGSIPELAEILTVLKAAEPVSEQFLAPDSLVREFIGDSQLQY